MSEGEGRSVLCPTQGEETETGRPSERANSARTSQKRSVSRARPDDVAFAAGLPRRAAEKIMRSILKEIANGAAVERPKRLHRDFVSVSRRSLAAEARSEWSALSQTRFGG